MHSSLPFEFLHFVSAYVAECPPLGMESHKIEPDQLSASSVSQYRYSPQRARLNMQVHNNFKSIYMAINVSPFQCFIVCYIINEIFT